MLQCILNTILFLRSQSETSAISDCVKMITQFLINLIVNNSGNCLTIYKTFKFDILLWMRSQHNNYESSALLYNIVRQHPNLILTDKIYYQTILDLYRNFPDNEYGTFLLDLLLKDLHFCLNYPNFTVEERLNILEVLREKCISKSPDFKFFPECVALLAAQFQTKSDCILKTVTDYLSPIEPSEVALLLEVLSSLSSEEEYLVNLRGSKSFMINCVFSLKSVHSLGKQSKNNFSSIETLAELGNVSEEMQEHPIFGFKANLIRLIGNLCWKHKGYQDEVSLKS